MPDENKFKKLREIGYNIPVTCGLCTYALIPRDQDWGTCRKHLYTHLKHSGPDREMSIVRYGTCPDALIYSSHFLGAHVEFLRENDGKAQVSKDKAPSLEQR